MLNKIDVLKRIINISYRHKIGHLSSNLTTAGILCDIYDARGWDDPVVLSNGHAGLALYCVLEAAMRKDAEALYDKHGTHPNRDLEDGIYATTGSLGMGLPVALGMALANRSRRVFCVISDGECAEGSIWESLAIKTKYRVDNLKVFANINGFSSYDPVDVFSLIGRITAFDPSVEIRMTNCPLPFAEGFKAHYHVLTEKQYAWMMEHAGSFA